MRELVTSRSAPLRYLLPWIEDMKCNHRVALSEPTSILLDALRFCAALAVLVGHFTQPAFSRLWPNMTMFSIAAVGAFFVMSGFVIDYTSSRHADLMDFSRARLVRLWSVVVPALLYTAVADYISWALNPDFYQEWYHSLSSNIVSLFADLAFLNQSWALNLSFGSDTPVWSLGYEAGYYAMFGAFAYLRGWLRVVVLLALIALKGPQLLILLPIWLLGVLTCRLVLGESGAVARLPVGLLMLTLCAATALLGHKDHTASIQLWFALMPGGAGLSAFVFTMLSCGFATSGIILLAEQSRHLWGPCMLVLKRPIRWLAQSTFTIYMFHLPTLILLQSATRYSRSSLSSTVGALALTFAVCIAFSFLTERRKSLWDRPVRSVLAFLRGENTLTKATLPTIGRGYPSAAVVMSGPLNDS